MMRAIRQILLPLVVFFLWNLAAQAALLSLPPWAAIGVVAVLFAGFLYGYVLPRGRSSLRLGPLTEDALRATLTAVPVLLVLTWALSAVWTQLIPIPPESLRPFERITRTSGGRLALSLLALASAPLLEELVFRGMVQRPLERRLGPGRGITLTAALFALFHFLPWLLPVHFLLGLAFGYAVWATRSIWAGVILHAANNTAAMLLMGTEPPEAVPTVWETGVTPEFRAAVVILALASGAAVWVARRLRRSGGRPWG
ncbi:MAG: CPBP family intramembrane metalloprotease [Gemmatimonadota bacterium]|nr:CPBP family intramembrane metalloprotease [Gemmatimonadota bacterium]